MLIDISPTISHKIAVWPGDTSFSHRYLCQMSQGDNLDLSTIETTVHVGAHADAPSHYIAGGEGIAERSLEYYYGRAQVIHVNIARGARILPEDISAPIEAPRVLFYTGSFPQPQHFNTDFNSLSPELIDFLAAVGVCLVGIDTPSVDPYSSKKLESHQAIAKHNFAVLEGLILAHVQTGIYDLIAFPLKIAGADASPVRAVLKKLDYT